MYATREKGLLSLWKEKKSHRLAFEIDDTESVRGQKETGKKKEAETGPAGCESRACCACELSRDRDVYSRGGSDLSDEARVATGGDEFGRDEAGRPAGRDRPAELLRCAVTRATLLSNTLSK